MRLSGLLKLSALVAGIAQAAINPVEVRGRHFFDSVTKEPVCIKQVHFLITSNMFSI